MIPIDQLNKKRDVIHSNLGKAQGIRVATLNIRGKLNERKESKYPRLTTLMRKNKIAVLAIQEARLDPTWSDKLMKENPRIHIESLGNSTARAGVAFILNKDLLSKSTWKYTEIIPEHVARLQLNWKENETLDLINIYMPNNNNPSEQVDFLKELHTQLNVLCVKDPILLGDFNLVEDNIDRIPHRTDNIDVQAQLATIKHAYALVDGWRTANPMLKDYTFYQNSSRSKSCIDRIYLNRQTYLLTYKWEILSLVHLSNHDIVLQSLWVDAKDQLK